MQMVNNDTRQILVKILMVAKDDPDPYSGLGYSECKLLNIVLDALGVPSDTSQGLSDSYREEFFQRWLQTPGDEASIEKYLDWAMEELNSALRLN